MTKRYGDPILVAQYSNSQPRCFIWHGTTYWVKEALAMWHLRDRWWEAKIIGPAASPRASASDRHYYRLECSPELICDLYYDLASDSWILDRIYD
jgi:hypothetical protein